MGDCTDSYKPSLQFLKSISWIVTTDNEDFSQVITEKSDFLFILVLEGQVYYEEPNEMRSLPASELRGNR